MSQILEGFAIHLLSSIRTRKTVNKYRLTKYNQQQQRQKKQNQSPVLKKAFPDRNKREIIGLVKKFRCSVLKHVKRKKF